VEKARAAEDEAQQHNAKLQREIWDVSGAFKGVPSGIRPSTIFLKITYLNVRMSPNASACGSQEKEKEAQQETVPPIDKDGSKRLKDLQSQEDVDRLERELGALRSKHASDLAEVSHAHNLESTTNLSPLTSVTEF
jgi:hypothetical protein